MYSRFKRVMDFVEEFGRQRNVWLQQGGWDGESITNLWSAIWLDLDPFMRTETRRKKDGVDSVSYHKSRKGQVSAVTVYNKLVRAGKIVKADRIRKPRKTRVPALELAAEKRRIVAVAKRREEEREAEERANLLAADLLRDLTPQEKASVDAAVLGQGEDGEIIARNGKDIVTKKSMRTLEPKTWLGNEVINFYLKECLTRRDQALCQANPSRKRSHCFSSFFLKQLMNGNKYSYKM